MALADFSAMDGLWVALALFFVLAGVGVAYLCVRWGATAGRLSSLITGLEREVLPVVAKTGGTVDRVNDQLDKLDRITDSAVDAAEATDGAVRVVANAVRTPVRKVSGFAAGVQHGTAAFKVRHDVKDAYEAGRAAAARREQDLDADLNGAPVSDEIVLVIPVDKPFYGVARLVVGGLAARLDLSYDELEDIQLALDTVLEHEEYAAGQDVTVRLRVADDAIAVAMGPLREPAVRAALADERDGVGLGRLLGTVAERVELEPRGDAHWLVFEKRVGAKA